MATRKISRKFLMFGMIFALLSTFQIQTPVAADSVEQSINVGGSPNTIAITPDGSKIIVMDWTMPPHEMNVYSLPNFTLLHSVPILGEAFGLEISADSAYAYAIDNTDNRFLKINLSDYSVYSVVVGSYPMNFALSQNGDTAYIVNYNDSTISVVNILARRQINIVPLPSGCGPQDITLKNNVLAIGCNLSKKILFYNEISLNSINEVSVDTSVNSIEYSPVSERLYVGGDSNVIYSINTSTFTVSSLATGYYPNTHGIVVSPDGTVVYVIDNRSQKVAKLNANSGALIQELVGLRSSYVGGVIPPTGDYLYFSASATGIVNKISITPNTALRPATSETNNCCIANGYRADDLGSVYFAHGSSKLSAKAKREIKSIIESNPAAIYKVTGYVQKSKSTKNNAKLSVARARAVESYLVTLGANVNFTVVIETGELSGKEFSSYKARRATIFAMVPVVL